MTAEEIWAAYTLEYFRKDLIYLVSNGDLNEGGSQGEFLKAFGLGAQGSAIVAGQSQPLGSFGLGLDNSQTGFLPLSRGNSFNEAFGGSQTFTALPVEDKAPTAPFDIAPAADDDDSGEDYEVDENTKKRKVKKDPVSATRSSRRPVKKPRKDDYDYSGDESPAPSRSKKDKDKEKSKGEKEKEKASTFNDNVPAASVSSVSTTTFPSHLSSPAKFNRSGSKRISLRELAMQEAAGAPDRIRSITDPLTPNEEIVASHAKDILRQIDSITEEIQKNIVRVGDLQVSYIKSRQAGLLKTLQVELKSLTEKIDDATDKLMLNAKSIAMDFESCHEVHSMLHKLNEQRIQVQLYDEELDHVLSIGAVRTVARLIIAQQPLRHVLFKEKTTEDVFVVKLLTGTNSYFDFVSDVSIQLYIEESGERQLQKASPLDYRPAKLENSPRTAFFDNIKLNTSSRMLLASLRFIVTLKLGRETQLVESEFSNQFIVITNESQFVDATTKLLMSELYGDSFASEAQMSATLIKWPTFSNLLQTHFISATSQRDAKATRALQYYEMNYIQRKFAQGASELTVRQVEKALEFVLNSERQIRFKRHLFHMFNAGVLFGFFPRDKIEQILMQQGVGSCIVRLSESQCGSFVVSYVADDSYNRIQHYLLKADDIGSNRTLPDFLRDVEQFQYILVFNYKNGEVIRKPKMDALSSWTQKKKVSSAAGYVDSVF